MFVLNLSDDNRILSISYLNEFTPDGAIIVEELPEGDISEYKYLNGEYIYCPIEKEKEDVIPFSFDYIEAQMVYTAMATNTLLPNSLNIDKIKKWQKLNLWTDEMVQQAINKML